MGRQLLAVLAESGLDIDRIGDRDITTSTTFTARSGIGPTVGVAVSTIAVVTEDTAEPIGNMGSAVIAR